ncbi:MAG: hypothetical protein GXW99_09340 [Clostridiales bacterium]|nr:hypothetical protein [Clostridiales bacterium]
MREKQHNRRITLASGLSCAVCLCLIAATVKYLPFMERQTENTIPLYYGSALFKSPAAGLILIILLSFALGISVTLLCRSLRKNRRGRDKK